MKIERLEVLKGSEYDNNVLNHFLFYLNIDGTVTCHRLIGLIGNFNHESCYILCSGFADGFDVVQTALRSTMKLRTLA
ncbi:hypothetical protein ACLKA7_014593 [Drosophila subpalustris]